MDLLDILLLKKMIEKMLRRVVGDVEHVEAVDLSGMYKTFLNSITAITNTLTDIPVREGVHMYCIDCRGRFRRYCRTGSDVSLLGSPLDAVLVVSGGKHDFPPLITSIHYYARTSDELGRTELEVAVNNMVSILLTCWGTITYMVYPLLPVANRWGFVLTVAYTRAVAKNIARREKPRRGLNCRCSIVSTLPIKKICTILGKVEDMCRREGRRLPNIVSIVDYAMVNLWYIDYTDFESVRNVRKMVYADATRASTSYIFGMFFDRSRIRVGAFMGCGSGI